MIISVSRRTDIFTFYGEWFFNRLDAGYCMVRNPRGKPYRDSLRREDVDGFVFWTKDIGPFMDKLAIIHGRGYPFYVQHTINNYPASLAPHVPPAGASVQNMRKLAELYGPDAAVWRYDPIIHTTLTPWESHLANFAKLAEALRGATNEAGISFVDNYKKMARNMALAGIPWSDPGGEEKKRMASELAAIAGANGMQLTLCCEAKSMPESTRPSRCIDATRLARVAGRPLRSKAKPDRPGCGCCDNRDIGEYDTCLHGCRYCYATNSLVVAQERHQAHDPHGETLIPAAAGT
jgi:hypothetical protein